MTKQKKKNWKRILSAVMCAVLILTSFTGMTVFADASSDTYSFESNWTAKAYSSSSGNEVGDVVGQVSFEMYTKGADLILVPYRINERIDAYLITFDTSVTYSSSDYIKTSYNSSSSLKYGSSNSANVTKTTAGGVTYKVVATFTGIGAVANANYSSHNYYDPYYYLDNISGGIDYYYGFNSDIDAIVDQIANGEIQPDLDYVEGNRIKDDNLSFVDFQCINNGISFQSAWNGYSANYDEYYLKVSADYYKGNLTIDTGTITEVIDWTADTTNRWSRTFTDFAYKEGYGRLSNITLTPYGLKEGNWFYGNYVKITFDEAGNIIHILQEGKTNSDIGKYSDTIPIPDVVVTEDSGLVNSFWLSNSNGDYYVEIQGRFLQYQEYDITYDGNINFSSPKVVGRRKIYGSLENWVSCDSRMPSTKQFNLSHFQRFFEDFLLENPVEDRIITGKENLFSDLSTQLKEMLSQLISQGTELEFYVRYYTVNNGQIYYGKWNHVYINSLENDYVFKQSQSGLDDVSKEQLEASGDSTNDVDLKVEEDLYTQNSNEVDLWAYVESLANNLGHVPQLVSDIFGFMPPWVSIMIGVGIGFIVILRFLGR